MTTKRILGAFSALLIAVLVLGVGVAAADDPQSGTWKMNPAKSKYSPGPAMKSNTLKIEVDGDSFKLESNGIDGKDQPVHFQIEGKYDGKDYPVTGSPYGDSISMKRINSNTVKSIWKRGGQPAITVTSVVSKDGKTRTTTLVGKNAQGQAVHNAVVYDKQ